MHNSYLHRLYHYNKKLFFIIVLFAGATLASNLTGFQSPPFFLWSMYSRPELPLDHYETLQTTIDGRVFDATSAYTDNTRLFLTQPLAYYREILENGRKDPSLSFLESKLQGRYSWIRPLEKRVYNGKQEVDAFPDWYRNYLSGVTNGPAGDLSVSVIRMHYDARQHIAVDSTFLFCTWKRP